MKNISRFITFFTFVLGAVSVQAGLIEVRAGAGLTSSDPNSFDSQLKTVGGGSFTSDDVETYNADVLINLPFLPIGAGVRYEFSSQDAATTFGGSAVSYDLDVQDISLLVNWRIIDTVAYFGPLVSVGMPSADFELNNAGTILDQSLDGDNLSFALAAEGGVRIKGFIVGAEAGYKSLEIESPSSATFNPAIDLSGFYGKVLVGVTFL